MAEFEEIPSYIPGSRELAGAQVLAGFVAAKQVEEGAQGPTPLAFEVGVASEDEAGVAIGDRDQLGMGGQPPTVTLPWRDDRMYMP